MTSRVLKPAIAATVGCLLFSTLILAQDLPPAPKAAHVAITQEPTLEMAIDNLAIIRWTTTNPGGDDQHFGIVRYGTDPRELSQMAKSPIRLNRGHPETIFRVRVEGLKPQTNYFYAVTSTASDGESDGVESSIRQFTTPGPGERIVAHPPEPALRPTPH
jgi:Purple acid Phosphatase, N-terminal domain